MANEDAGNEMRFILRIRIKYNVAGAECDDGNDFKSFERDVLVKIQQKYATLLPLHRVYRRRIAVAPINRIRFGGNHNQTPDSRHISEFRINVAKCVGQNSIFEQKR